ncbi:hypothetical protein NL533_31010, partial [Klebsiella pneumoniae]|nr:hypothetical protein [Klebsiella pneumoniae]
MAAAPAEPLAELLNTTVGHYRPTQIIAQGRSSVVFRAQDTADARTVALKVLKPPTTRSDGEMQRLAKVLKPLAAMQ